MLRWMAARSSAISCLERSSRLCSSKHWSACASMPAMGKLLPQIGQSKRPCCIGGDGGGGGGGGGGWLLGADVALDLDDVGVRVCDGMCVSEVDITSRGQIKAESTFKGRTCRWHSKQANNKQCPQNTNDELS